MVKQKTKGIVLMGAGLLLLLYFTGSVLTMATVPSFLPYFEAWVAEDGVYIGANPIERGGEYYSFVAYAQETSTLNGESLTLATTPFDSGNGVCGIYDCGGTNPEGNQVYIAITGDVCPDMYNFKIYDVGPTVEGAFSTTIMSARGGATDLLYLQDVAMTAACQDIIEDCEGAQCDYQVGAFTLTHTFTGSGDPVCGNDICETGEDETNCPADCSATPPYCGDGQCNNDETPTTCPEDCPSTPIDGGIMNAIGMGLGGLLLAVGFMEYRRR